MHIYLPNTLVVVRIPFEIVMVDESLLQIHIRRGSN